MARERKYGFELDRLLDSKPCPHKREHRTDCDICWNEDVAEFQRKAWKIGFEAGKRVGMQALSIGHGPCYSCSRRPRKYATGLCEECEVIASASDPVRQS